MDLVVALAVFRVILLPPHARGWTRYRKPSTLSAAVTIASPARAGMDRSTRTRPWFRLDGWFPPHARGWTVVERRRSQGTGNISFPRTRGDGPSIRRRLRSPPNLFPPHARGWTGSDRVVQTHVDSASPARAGMDLLDFTVVRTCPCFPRTRGDGPESIRTDRLVTEVLPPHARGWTQR